MSKKSKSIATKMNRTQQILLGTFWILLSILLAVAFISFFTTWQSDQSSLLEFSDRNAEVQNAAKKFGALIAHLFIYQLFGIASLIWVGLLFLTGVYLFVGAQTTKITSRWLWGSSVIVWFSLFFGFFFQKYPLLGGVVGYEMNHFLQVYIGWIGVALLLLFGLIVFLVVQLKLTPEKIASLFKNEVKNSTLVSDEESTAPSISLDTDSKTKTFEIDKETLKPTISKHSSIASVSEEQTSKPKETSSELTMEIEVKEEETTPEDQLAKRLVKDFGEFDPTLELKNYKHPTIDLLKDYNNGGGITINQEELEENKEKIVDTLRNYKIDIAQIKATIGPTVTLYEIVPEAGVRISKIKNLEDDIALSLSALGIRIIAPIPGKGTIGIEVPNKNATIVSMRSVIASTKFTEAEMELPLALGKTISNETYVVDLAKMPHLLMAGATGQGKSVGLNAVLTSLLYKKHPSEIKFVLVDPKKVELTLFNKIERHYLAKLPDTDEAIITDNKQVINTLNSLCIEMDNRYDMLKNAMCRNIKEYNVKFKSRKLNPNDGNAFLPYIVLIIDEFADLIMTAGKEVETPIARLAQLARAVGIHLIIATQRPSVNVITGLIKANFPARIAFRVTSKIDSRTILDSGGADQLIGRGDMLYTQGNKLIRLQCAFVDTPEVEKITEYIGSQRAYPTSHQLPEYVGEESGTTLDNNVSDRDVLFKEAAEVIVNAQQGSASLLQRKMKLGYNRAGRIIDQLEAAGIVGPFEGSKARQVLIKDMLSLQSFFENENNA